MTQSFNNIQESLAAANSNLEEIASDLQSQADKIQELMDTIAGGLTAEEAEAVVASLSNLKDRSRAIADIVSPAVDPGDVEPVPAPEDGAGV